MTELLQSIRADLLSRRLLPFLALVVVALVAALAYALTSGSSESAPPPSTAAPSAPAAGGKPTLPVAVAPVNPNLAVSETPGGARFQSQGATRDPFVPLPTPVAKTASTSAATGKSSSASSSSGSGGSSSSGGTSAGPSGGGSGGGAQPAPAPTPKKPAKPQFPYVVSVLFGRASTTPGQPATLSPYENLKPSRPLPSKQEARISLERVTGDGKGAVFALLAPPILHGSGVCLPSASECLTIELRVGQAEELEYVDVGGQLVSYELKIVSIAKKGSASAAKAASEAKTALAGSQRGAAQGIGRASALIVPAASGRR